MPPIGKTDWIHDTSGEKTDYELRYAFYIGVY